MTHRQKLRKLARILLTKHDGAAKDVVRERVQQSFDNGDYAAVRLWTDVAETVTQIAANDGLPRLQQDDQDERRNICGFS